MRGLAAWPPPKRVRPGWTLRPVTELSEQLELADKDRDVGSREADTALNEQKRQVSL